MAHFKNKRGSEIYIFIKSDNTFAGSSWQDKEAFIETITHKLVNVWFDSGRAICIQICGFRNLQIPKKCKTLQDVAAWINTKDF